jgi:phosphoribosylaminoimidazole-succinocarboxamide synthase
LGPKLAEGKTKIIYAHPQDDSLAWMAHKDAITAGDGAKRDVLADKGELSCRTTTACFRYLERRGIPTHYVATPEPRTMLVRRAEMVPIEWVARRLATGSYVRRTGVAEGTRFEPLVLELFLKDDARHDPQISSEEAVRDGLCTEQEVATALQITQQVFLALEEAWAAQDIQLVDLKIEFGRTPDGLVVADVIDNDSWRLWPGGKREEMLDKQVYRDLQKRDAGALADVRRRYVEVARRAEAFRA